MRTIFMGSADFGLPALEALIGAGHEIVGIVTTPPKPKGRGLKVRPSAVEEFARGKGLGPVLAPTKLRSESFVTSLRELRPDLSVVAAFRILPRSVLAIPPEGTVNIHGSLLPKYRGPAPIQRAIEQGETRTGVSIFKIAPGIDTGDIILRKETPIGPDETTPQLYERLRELGAQALIEALEMLRKGTAYPEPQDHAAATKAPKLSKEEARIDWTLPAAAIYNKVRAFKPFPGTHTFLKGKRLGIEWARPVDADSQKPAGTVVSVHGEGFEVQCGKGILSVVDVKPEGKRAMGAEEFVRGARLETGTELE